MTHPDDTTLQTHFDGALPEAERVIVERHLAGCSRCAGSLRALGAMRASFDRWADALPDDDLSDAIFAKINGPTVAPDGPKILSLDAARERRSFSVRRVVFPALAVAAAAIVALRFAPTTDRPHLPVPPVVALHPPDPLTSPVVVGGGLGGAEVTRVDVQGAQSYAVLEIPGVGPGVTTAVVWIQDLGDDETSPSTTQ